VLIGSNLLCLEVIIFPAVEKTLSEDADEAGIDKICLANKDTLGNEIVFRILTTNYLGPYYDLFVVSINIL